MPKLKMNKKLSCSDVNFNDVNLENNLIKEENKNLKELLFITQVLFTFN